MNAIYTETYAAKPPWITKIRHRMWKQQDRAQVARSLLLHRQVNIHWPPSVVPAHGNMWTLHHNLTQPWEPVSYCCGKHICVAMAMKWHRVRKWQLFSWCESMQEQSTSNAFLFLVYSAVFWKANFSLTKANLFSDKIIASQISFFFLELLHGFVVFMKEQQSERWNKM